MDNIGYVQRKLTQMTPFLIFFFAALGYLATGSSPAWTQQERMSDVAIPWEGVRSAVKNIKVEDVARLRFYGPHLCYAESGPLDITDPTLIGRFLDALKQATWGGDKRARMGRPWSGSMVMFLKSGKPPKGTLFDYSTRSPLDCYGLPFQSALRALGRYQAAKLRQLLRAKRTQVVGVRLAKGNYVDDPQVLKRLLDELEQANDAIFAYASPGCPLIIYLSLKRGRDIPVPLVLHSIPPNLYDDPNGRGRMPLALWQVYVHHARQQRREPEPPR